MAAIYTKTGDRGETGLFGGTRVAKQSDRVEAYGTLDEANAAIGVAKAALPDGWIKTRLRTMQLRLFVVAAEVASDERGRAIIGDTVSDADVSALEALIDRCVGITGPPRNFVVPGRDPVSAALHLARTLARRAERRLLTLAETSEVRPEVIKYCNRLSDALYALARVAETREDERRIEAIVRGAVLAAVDDRMEEPPPVEHQYNLAAAKAMAQAAEDKANTMGVPIVFAAVDAGGNLLLLHRMTDSLLASIDLAVNKAYTSAALKTATHLLKQKAREEGPLFGIQTSNDGRIVLFGGGEPLYEAGRLAGGVGVSGGTVEEDIIIVKHALRAGWGH